MKSIRFCIVISVFLILAVSCASPTTALPTTAPTPSLDLQKTETFKADQTLSAQSTTDAQATQQANATSTAIMQKTQEALDKAATIKAEAIIKLTATSVASTAQAQSLLDTIEKVGFKDAPVGASGTYYRLEDSEASLAKINYIDTVYYSEHEAENFAIRADISWDSASDKANWDRSACGFLFGVHESDYFDFIVLTLQGYVRFSRPQPGSNTLYTFADQRYSGEIQRPKGDAEVLLVVMDKRAHFYVNGEEVLNEYDGRMKPGGIYYVMISGTNKDFGTSCKWSNVDLWIFD